MQERIAWNRGWYYRPSPAPGDAACTPSVAGFMPVELPHTNRLLPLNCFDEQAYQFCSCYKKIFSWSPDWAGKDVFVDFEGVMAACTVHLNGHPVGQHTGGYLPFTIELTPWLQHGENVLVVEVDSTERPDIPPFGHVVDFLTYGGIYREVALRIAGPLRIERAMLDCPDPLAPVKSLRCRYSVASRSAGPAALTVTLAAKADPGKILAGKTFPVALPERDGWCEATLDGLTDLQLWDIDNPCLYLVQASLQCDAGEDTFVQTFGFRSARFTTDGFVLNGRRVKLVGLNRHQSWPYNGYAMPERIQRRDAEILRRELGCNIVRTSHYPQSRHFLDACDELGLLVMEEIPGWQHIGNAAWQAQACQNVQSMIERDYNRPSIILWGVRINESQDSHDFYQKTNAIAHELDAGRQTGGVRYITRSELLEDVYTYNDFTHAGQAEVLRPQKQTTGLDHPVPLLVTESNGHMYPTKSYDQESRVVEHALRHLRVMEAALARDDLCGELSWCAFDYNTHSSFGSGDKICYHGVCDMFRNPKYAAYSYRSQKSPAEEIVLEPITRASRGERDGGGTVPFYVLTNCDAVRLYKNGRLVDDFTPDRSAFPHLPHPPVTVGHLMEKELDFGLPEEDGRAFRAFLIQKVTAGTLLVMGADDYAYIGQLAARCHTTPAKLYGAAVKAAGGWGEDANDLVLEGILNGQVVCRREIGEKHSYKTLQALPDDDVLVADGDTYDATRIAVYARDEWGNPLPFVQECVTVSIDGPADLLGPAQFPLLGGCAAFWIRTINQTGTVNITVTGLSKQAHCAIAVRSLRPVGSGGKRTQ